MKKYIFILISLCISTFSAWSVWEGNGIAGATTDFQEDGMFVKSSLFPKYTLVEIVNLENDIVGKYVEKLLGLGEPTVYGGTRQKDDNESGLTLEFLAENGF